MRSGGDGSDSFEFVRVKVDAAATAVKDVERHAARALFQEWVFARRTYHKARSILKYGRPAHGEFYPEPNS